MARINDNYLKLAAGYLFPEIGRRVTAFCDANPDADVIRLGIGDVTEPLPAAISKAMHDAVDEMSAASLLCSVQKAQIIEKEGKLFVNTYGHD